MTTSTFQCLTVNDLPPVDFIAGTEQTFTFDIYDGTTACPVDLSSSTCTWVMSPYGNPNYATLNLDGVISGSPTNRFTITVSGSSTQLLSGKFTHQPRIVDFGGSEFNPSQGLLQINPRNATI